jgi:hypothetical protein
MLGVEWSKSWKLQSVDAMKSWDNCARSVVNWHTYQLHYLNILRLGVHLSLWASHRLSVEGRPHGWWGGPHQTCTRPDTSWLTLWFDQLKAKIYLLSTNRALISMYLSTVRHSWWPTLWISRSNRLSLSEVLIEVSCAYVISHWKNNWP